MSKYPWQEIDMKAVHISRQERNVQISFDIKYCLNLFFIKGFKIYKRFL
jgi:hypothetical protein